MQVYAFYRIGSENEDLKSISTYLKDNFALDADSIAFLPVICDEKLTDSFNTVSGSDPNDIVAPGCLLSIKNQRQEEVVSSAKL